MGSKIILTGSTGKLGSAVLDNLLQLVPPSDIIASVYNPSGHQDLKDKGIEVRQGDFNNPETLVSAFKGGDKLLLISLPSRDDDYRIRAQTAAIDAAKKAGVKHVYYTSLNFADGSQAKVMKAHFATEDYLKKSGLDYTIVREGGYMESYSIYLGFWNSSSNKVVVPGDGAVSFADRNELAEATAKLLVTDEFKNRVVTLAGARAYTLKETTEILSTILKKDIEFEQVTEQDFIDRNDALRDVAEWWASTYPSLANGDGAILDDTLERLLGRTPRRFEDMLRSTLKEDPGASKEMDEWVAH